MNSNLGKAYRFVCDQRSQESGHAGQIAAFMRLVETLRGAQRDADIDFERVTVSVRTAKQMAGERERDLAVSQGEIRQQVAKLVETSNKRQIESLASLPEEVERKKKNRDLLRTKHAQESRSAMRDLMESAKEVARPLVDGWEDISTCAHLEGRVLVKLVEREQRLSAALEEARAGMEAYNTRVAAEGQQSVMGAHVSAASAAPMPDAPRHEITFALSSYEDWSETYVSKAHARKSDAAMADARGQIFANVDQILGLSMPENMVTDEAGSCGSLEQALRCAGEAVAEEREHQLGDALGFFPCTALARAGQKLLGAWQDEHATVRDLVQCHQRLERDLAVHEACMDGSGELSKEKEQVVRDLCHAHDEHKKATKMLKTLSPWIDGENEEMLRVVSTALGMHEVPSLDDLRRNTREKLNVLTENTRKLTGKIQHHFPEVIVYVGYGLPPELGGLWRPAHAHESFDEKEPVPSASNHKVWRVRNGDEWFALKEYTISEPGRLQTCLKEATLVCQQRHPAIVEMTALFQNVDGTSFYMQMPWYEHGSLDKWVRGDQRPGWPRVRSVLQDALVGLAHLHDNGVLHCDVKPANILVDSRERGRLGDFDISIDTMTRTSAANICTTMLATAVGMTVDFAAPELQASGMATKQTDLFAYGKTVLCVHEYCEPKDDGDEDDGAEHNDTARGQTDAVIAALTSENPKARLSAKDAIRQPFFAILNDVSRREQQECCTCLDNFPTAAGLGCEWSADHFICATCAPREVQRILGEAQEEETSLARHRAHGGRIKCVLPDCEAMYAESTLARILPDELFREYRAAQDAVVEQRLFEELQQRFQEQLAAAKEEFESANRATRAAHDAAATAEFMRRQYPNAVQCPRCHAGPVIPENCYDLQAHHGETLPRGRGRISNACPSCHFFSRERGDWVRWDGQLR